MNKQQTLFTLSILILLSGISLDLYGIGLIAKILIIIGVLFSIFVSINHKKEAIKDCSRLENEVSALENNTSSLKNQIIDLKEKIKTIERINSIGQKHMHEIQKSSSKAELSSNFISTICEDLKASKGAIFLVKDKMLEYTAGFAYKGSSDEVLKFDFGEGLIGQVAESKKIINLTDIPEDYIEINSGLGEAKPKNIIIYPIAYGGNLLGVFELATFKTLTEEETNLLGLISSNIATKLSSFKN